MLPTFRLLLAALACLVLLPAAAFAGVPDAPLHWARGNVSGNGQAVEHVTIRARASGGHDTFVRFAMANAGFKRGELVVTFRQESAAGTLYAKSTFDRGDYTVQGDRLGLKAGKHTLQVQNGQLTASLDFGTVKANLSLSSQAGALKAVDSGGGGYVHRELLVPLGRLSVSATDNAGRSVNHTATAFAVHECSTATAHQVYDRSVQLHHLVGGNVLIVDYIVLPASRGGKPLGFVVVSGKGKTFVGEVAKEVRENEKVDGKKDYRVPWLVSVLGKRGDSKAAVRLTAEKQIAREDDLADLNFVARKAVGALMHPVTYTLKAGALAEVQAADDPAPVALDAQVRYKYSQVR